MEQLYLRAPGRSTLKRTQICLGRSFEEYCENFFAGVKTLDKRRVDFSSGSLLPFTSLMYLLLPDTLSFPLPAVVAAMLEFHKCINIWPQPSRRLLPRLLFDMLRILQTSASLLYCLLLRRLDFLSQTSIIFLHRL